MQSTSCDVSALSWSLSLPSSDNKFYIISQFWGNPLPFIFIRKIYLLKITMNQAIFVFCPPFLKPQILHTMYTYLYFVSKVDCEAQHVWLLAYIFPKLRYAIGLFFGRSCMGTWLKTLGGMMDIRFILGSSKMRTPPAHIWSLPATRNFICSKNTGIPSYVQGFVFRLSGHVKRSQTSFSISSLLIHSNLCLLDIKGWEANVLSGCDRAKLTQSCSKYDSSRLLSSRVRLSELLNNICICPWYVLAQRYCKTLCACLLFFGTCPNVQATPLCPLSSLPKIKYSCIMFGLSVSGDYIRSLKLDGGI